MAARIKSRVVDDTVWPRTSPFDAVNLGSTLAQTKVFNYHPPNVHLFEPFNLAIRLNPLAPKDTGEKRGAAFNGTNVDGVNP